jgi:hypothetical protein
MMNSILNRDPSHGFDPPINLFLCIEIRKGKSDHALFPSIEMLVDQGRAVGSGPGGNLILLPKLERQVGRVHALYCQRNDGQTGP